MRLEFHALLVALLATIEFHNMWDYDRLAKEWDTHRTHMLRTDYNESLAAAIELSLTSPTFHELGHSPFRGSSRNSVLIQCAVLGPSFPGAVVFP